MKQDIQLTERAAQHVKKILAKSDAGIGLRVGIKLAGCSGYQYVVETAKKRQEHDMVFECHNIKIFVDKQSHIFLTGVVIDFVKKGLSAEFLFKNPNVQATCGCGESFSIENQAI